MLKKAVAEHQETPAPIAEKRDGVDLPQNVMDNVMENADDRIGSEIDRRLEEISSSTEITANELKELRARYMQKKRAEKGLSIRYRNAPLEKGVEQSKGRR